MYNSWVAFLRPLALHRELYRQQLEMFENNSQRVDDRIVSISQAHVRPIKRGKAGCDTEFGAKLSLSVVDGFTFVDRLSWDNYNESLDLIAQIERYKHRFGFYPDSVHVDKIYRTRVNRAFCKQHGIRMGVPPLGRPPKHVSKEDKKLAVADEAIRNHVEGKFGQGKRRFGLAHIMAKLADTSAAQISLTFLVMNLEQALKQFLSALFLWCHGLARQFFARGHVR
jgi:IS5 family transposase